jgi:hypothetical protein
MILEVHSVFSVVKAATVLSAAAAHVDIHCSPIFQIIIMIINVIVIYWY